MIVAKTIPVRVGEMTNSTMRMTRIEIKARTKIEALDPSTSWMT